MGFRYVDATPPLGDGFVALDDLTVVLGANDVGKSRLLALMQCALAEPLPQYKSQPPATWFVELSDEELEIVVAHGAGELLRDDAFARPMFSGGIVERAGGFRVKSWWTSSLAQNPTASPATVDEYVRLIAQHRPEPQDLWGIVLEELRASRILALYLDAGDLDGMNEGNRHVGWRCHWCLPPVADLRPDVRGAVEQLGLVDGDLGAPVLVAPIGSMELPVMPIAIGVPRALEDVRVALDRAIERLVVHAKDALTARVEHWGAVQWIPDKGKGVLVDSDESGRVGVHPDVRSACAFVEQTAGKLLPGFVADRYEIRLAVRPILEWTDDHRIDICLRDRASGNTFPMADVAQGHQLWLQLVLFEAVNACDRMRITLELALENDLPYLEDAYFEESEEIGEDLVVEGRRVAERAGRTQYLDALEQFRRGDLTPLQASLPELVGRMERLSWIDSTTTWAPGIELLEPTRSRLYFIDEPEQHLHPRLQREASRWLVEFLRARPSQAIVATHAVPFLDAGGDPGATLLHVSRSDTGRTELVPIVAGSLSALDDAAGELGLDRGELLASTAVLLFVEGRADQRILEALFGPRLRSAGVTVVPIHGANRAAGVAEAETLLRFTAARVAVWLDNVPADVLQRMQIDPEFAATVKANKEKKYGSEEKTMADLLITAREHGRQIEPLPHTGTDVFDLLDDATIRQIYPQYPGHTIAVKERAAQREKGNTDWKRRYEKLYGIDMRAQALEDIASRMRAEEVQPHADLENVVFTCERLSLEVR
jgi:hypothetical protein